MRFATPAPADIAAITASMPMRCCTARRRSRSSRPTKPRWSAAAKRCWPAAIRIWLPNWPVRRGLCLCGAYRARPAYHWCVEDSIYVDPQFHRRGIGKILLARLIAEARQRGFRQMIAVIGDSAQAASIALHAAAGFRISAVACGRLQARPLARYRADAATAGQRRHGAAVKPAQPATTRTERSSTLSTRSSSWPRRRMWPVAEITL